MKNVNLVKITSIVFSIIATIAFFAAFLLFRPMHYEGLVVVRKGDRMISVVQRMNYRQREVYIPFAYFVRDIKYGEFEISTKDSFYNFAKKLQSSDFYYRKAIVKPGSTNEDVKKEFVEYKGLKGSFPENLKEGEMLPETYYYVYGQDLSKVIGRAKSDMKKKVEGLLKTYKIPKEVGTYDNLISLASIVEIESYDDEDKRLIAGVFINRLKKGMRLESDPTVIFQKTGGEFNKGVRVIYKDLDTSGIYNTYRMRGIPKYPISNPSIESIEAVLNYTKSDYLFFVADPINKGKHLFSTNFKEHHRKATKYRKSIK